jgi:hypothetical protein
VKGVVMGGFDKTYEIACYIIMAFTEGYPKPSAITIAHLLEKAVQITGIEKTDELIEWAKDYAKDYAKEWYEKNIK